MLKPDKNLSALSIPNHLIAGKEYNSIPFEVEGLTLTKQSQYDSLGGIIDNDFFLEWESPVIPQDEGLLFAVTGQLNLSDIKVLLTDGLKASVLIPYVTWDAKNKSFKALTPVNWKTPWLIITNPLKSANPQKSEKE